MVHREVYLVAEQRLSGIAFQLASSSLRPATGSPLCGRRQSAATSEALGVELAVEFGKQLLGKAPPGQLTANRDRLERSGTA